MVKKQSKRKISTRLLRKGALIEETYTAFRSWDLKESFDSNLHALRESNVFGARNQSWLREITSTLSSRFGSQVHLGPLINMAKADLGLETWKPCLLWHLATSDILYRQFALEWLYPAFRQGMYRIRTDDVVPFVREITTGKIASGGSLSEYGLVRAARDLLLMASSFGLLSRSSQHQFVHYHMPEESFLYILHALAERECNPRNLIEAKDWHLFLMSAQSVERELLELHQFKKLGFEMAGSIMRLDLPCRSLDEYLGRFATNE
ncbi:MAG: BrxA family protein [Syntrophales bacterium]